MSRHRLREVAHLVLCTAPLGLLALVPSTAHADPNRVCIPNFNPLPNPIPDGNTPNWWGTADGRFETQRWNGASMRSFANGATDTAWVKTAWDAGSNKLYVHYHVDFDLGADPDVDHIVLALAPTAGSDRLVIDIDPMQAPGCATSACTNADATAAVQYAIQPAAGGAAGAFTASAPTGWNAVEYPRVWLTKTPIGSSSYSYEWDVKFRVSLPGALGDSGKLYTAMLVGLAAGSSGYNVLSMNWPRAAGSSGSNAMTSIDPTAASIAAGIGTVTFGDLAFASRCNDGIYVQAGDLGSTFGATLPSLSNKINLNAGGTTTFVVRPTNQTGATVDAEVLEADFYLANWGINGTAGLWTKINSTPVSLSGAVPNGEKADGQSGRGAMTFDWTIPSAEQPLYAANPHQCVQVVLSAVGVPLDIASDGFWQNMDFRTASVVREEATVDVAGLGQPPAGHGKHRIWLYVDAERAPTPAVCAAAKRGELLPEAPGVVGKSTKKRATPKVPVKIPEGCDNGAGARFTMLPAEAAARTAEKRQVAFEGLMGRLVETKQAGARAKLLAAAGIDPLDTDITADDMAVGELEGAVSAHELPQVVVRAMRETGETVGIDGKLHPLVTPMSSFGYYLQHQGELRGWEVALHGAKRVGDHAYLLELGEGEIATISTTVRAIDDKTAPCADDPKGEGCDAPRPAGARRHPRLDRPVEPDPAPTPNPQPPEVKKNDKCNCSATPAPADGVAAIGLALLVAAGMRRRRRRAVAR